MSGDNQTGGSSGGSSSTQSSVAMPGAVNAIASQLAAGFGPQDYTAYLNQIYAGHGNGSSGGTGSSIIVRI